MSEVAWADVAARVRPFVARRVGPSDVDDVVQDALLRVQRGVGALREGQRLDAWVLQVARSAVAEHYRAAARHPWAPEQAPEPVAPEPEDDRAALRELAGVVGLFVEGLPAPYREALTLVDLGRMRQQDAADALGVGLSALKARVRRGRAMLRGAVEACCRIELDVRGAVVGCAPRSGGGGPAGCCEG